MLLPFGKLDLGLHGSAGSGRGGGAGLFTWSLPGRGVSLSLYALARTADYRHLGGGDERDLFETGGRLDWSLDPLHGSFEGRFHERHDHTRLATGRASLAVTIAPGLDLTFAGGLARGDDGAGFDGLVLLSLVPGSRFSTHIAEHLGPDGRETVVGTNLPMRTAGDDAGLDTSLTIGDPLRFLARPKLQTSYGLYQSSLAYDADGLTGTLDASGAIVDGAGFALAPPVRGSFALVDLPDGVAARVFREHREVGRSDDGAIVLNDLLPYYANRIGIAVDDLPLDREVGVTEKLIAPPYRGGARVTFDVRVTRYVRGRLVIARAVIERPECGSPPCSPSPEICPAFGRLVVQTPTGMVDSPLGRKAEFELATVAPGRYPATVEHTAGRCDFTLEVPTPDAANAPVQDLGRVVCVQAPPAPGAP